MSSVIDDIMGRRRRGGPVGDIRKMLPERKEELVPKLGMRNEELGMEGSGNAVPENAENAENAGTVVDAADRDKNAPGTVTSNTSGTSGNTSGTAGVAAIELSPENLGVGNFYERYAKEVDAENERRKEELYRNGRRLRNKRLMATIGDGLNAFSEAYYAARSNGREKVERRPSLTGRWQQRYEALEQERSKNAKWYADAMKGLSEARRKDDLAKLEQAYKERSLEIREKEHERLLSKTQAEVTLSVAKAAHLETEDEIARAESDAKIKLLEAGATEKEASARAKEVVAEARRMQAAAAADKSKSDAESNRMKAAAQAEKDRAIAGYNNRRSGTSGGGGRSGKKYTLGSENFGSYTDYERKVYVYANKFKIKTRGRDVAEIAADVEMKLNSGGEGGNTPPSRQNGGNGGNSKTPPSRRKKK